MYLQLFYLSIIFSFSCLLSFDFQHAKVRRNLGLAKNNFSNTEQGRNLRPLIRCFETSQIL